MAVPVRSDLRAPDLTTAIETVYRVQGPRLWRSIFAFALSANVADDSVAEAFTQLLRRGDGVRDPAAWVWRAAFKIAAGELQRARRECNEVVVDLPYEHDLDAMVLGDELARLSSMQRASVVLRDYAGYSAREAAEILGSTEAAVRVHTHRARQRLRRSLADTF